MRWVAGLLVWWLCAVAIAEQPATPQDPSAPASTPAPAPANKAVASADLLEKRLRFVETAPAQIADGRADLLKGMADLKAKGDIKPADLRKMCEIVNQQTASTVETLHKVVAWLATPGSQAAMSAEQLSRFEASRPAADALAATMDCSGI